MPGGYVTIMGYSNATHSKRINYFSSPNLVYNGSVTGHEWADVRKAHLKRKHTMSLHGDESGKCPRYQWCPIQMQRPVQPTPVSVRTTDQKSLCSRLLKHSRYFYDFKSIRPI